ncbi:hypothetical protein V6B14_22230 (plasmid) [Sporosarcina psychrophila]|uniref:hypothetical protein n=1 Tax=Sporosarcina psychrophila TaxID=1476 RepID=UPI0030D32245
MSLHEGEYENRLVAFIDILGFSALVQKSENDALYAEKLFNALERIRQEVEHNKKKQTTENSALEMVQFSDSLVVSLPYTNSTSFSIFVMKLNWIQKTLADEGILIRGGVSAGKLYHKGTISYGPAFIRAFNIETALADHPRIVIDPQIMNLKLLPENEDLVDSKFLMGFHNFEGNRNPIVLEDVDGLYFINYLYGMYEEEGIAKKLHNFVLQELESLDSNSLSDSKVIRKLKWTLAYIKSCPWRY